MEKLKCKVFIQGTNETSNELENRINDFLEQYSKNASSISIRGNEDGTVFSIVLAFQEIKSSIGFN